LIEEGVAMGKNTILSGMRPTGRLHLGHLSVLENWRRFQEKYNCYFMVANWHALTTAFDDPGLTVQATKDMVLDWLMVGLDPEQSAIFVQSEVKEHAELNLLLSLITPLSWLERCPTYKDQVQQFREQGKDITTYGFLGYPLLMAADIIIYKANLVPVGEDQLPHLEFCREVVRRFNHLYKQDVFPEPAACLDKVAMIPGLDGRKMSKSYGNEIPLYSNPEEIAARVRMMVTDPQRIHAHDPGRPEICTVYSFHRVFNRSAAEEVEQGCIKGEIGCVSCKKSLVKALIERLSPCWERRRELEQNPDYVWDVLNEGNRLARGKASQTMEEVRAAMGFEVPGSS
jgi:tryptophanyl-tRNA synthetase